MDTNTKEIAFRLEKLEDKIDNLRFSRIDEITDQIESLEDRLASFWRAQEGLVIKFRAMKEYTTSRIEPLMDAPDFDPDDHDLYTKEEVCNVAMEEANDQFVALRKELPQLIEDKINEMKGASDEV